MGEKENPQRLKSIGSHQPGPRSYNKKYSSFVKTMRLALPAVAIIIVIFLFIRLNADDPAMITSAPQAETETQGHSQMMSAKYEGINDKGNPYTVTAKKAERSTIDPTIMNMTEPMADMLLGDGSWIALQADFGRYDQEAETLLLQGLVKLYHDSGHEMKTGEVLLDLKAGTINGNTPVNAQGPKGTLNATGLRIENGGKTIIFTGPAKMRLNRQE